MRMRFFYKCLLCLLAILASCSAPKEVLYLQDIASLKEEVIDKNGCLTAVYFRRRF